MNITVLCVGQIKEKYFRDAIAEYSKRLSRYCKLQVIEVADEKTKEKSIRKIYLVQNDFLKILGKKNEKYKIGTRKIEGKFYIDIYIKDLKTNKSLIIKRDNIHIYYESAGIKLFSM